MDSVNTAWKLTGPVLCKENPARAAEWSNQPIYIDQGRFTRQIPSGPIREISGWVIPGLVDVHAHIGVGENGHSDGSSGMDSTAEMQAQAQAHLSRGILAIRDCGSPVDNSVIQGREDMPILIRCGHHLARPKRYIRYLGLDLENPAELPEVAVQQVAAGDGWVKLVGDWIDRAEGADSRLRPLWSREVLIDAVAGVHEVGGRVTVHTFSHEAIDDLLEAGVDCIEHGTGMDDDQISEAARRGIAITPTLKQVGLFNQFAAQAGTKFPVYAKEMLEMHRNRFNQVAKFVALGVQILPGTDSGGYQEHGCLPSELALWEQAGINPSMVADFATWRVRDFLGLESIWPTAVADCVVYETNPAVSTGAYAKPRAVFRAGRQLI